MVWRILLMSIFLAPSIPATTGFAVTEQNLSRREIRALPIHERPNRVGHFYGNTVRRRNAR